MVEVATAPQRALTRYAPAWPYLRWVIVLAVVVVILGTVLRQPPPMTTVMEPEPVIVEQAVTVTSGMQAVMGQTLFHQPARTTGVSPDTLRFTFDKDVELVGILVSADIRNLALVEFAVGVNQPIAYDPHGAGWLFHVSDASDGPSKIDEHIWLPQPVTLSPNDYLSVGAWIWNGTDSEQAVSPEVIVYFTSRPGA